MHPKGIETNFPFHHTIHKFDLTALAFSNVGGKNKCLITLTSAHYSVDPLYYHNSTNSFPVYNLKRRNYFLCTLTAQQGSCFFSAFLVQQSITMATPKMLLPLYFCDKLQPLKLAKHKNIKSQL